ncbi:MAE_28990/MAE_18760 family HEPN-like nuclease [Acetobacter sp. AAB5]|uniref:MAE_28990/MAE_18760 family HEPN-like nuclease n=1 Tax=Acetobacter sp. AAB5 TaxID=3418370 RepID=UPI003CF94FDB
MLGVSSDFSKRKREVRRYITRLVVFEKELPLTSGTRLLEDLKIYRACAFLMLYNIIEASARECLLSIYDKIKTNNVLFDHLVEGIKIKSLDDFKNHCGKEKFSAFQNISLDIIDAGFDVKKTFNGNVDARKIKQIAEKYGFESNTDYRETHHGKELLTIKIQRQNLAHGEKSFSDVGRDYTALQIREIAEFSLSYMAEILKNVDLYVGHCDFILSDEKYKYS